MYYRNAQSALVVYDLTKPTSLIKAKHWVAELQRQASPGIVIALVGNKLDLVVDESSDSSLSSGGAGNDEERIERSGSDDGAEGNIGDGADEVDAAETSTSARKISAAEARSYAEEEGLLFFETSAKTGVNVQEVFTAIANAIPETQLKGARGPGAVGGGGAAGGQGDRGRQGGARDEGRVSLTGPRGEAAKEGCAC